MWSTFQRWLSRRFQTCLLISSILSWKFRPQSAKEPTLGLSANSKRTWPAWNPESPSPKSSHYVQNLWNWSSTKCSMWMFRVYWICMNNHQSILQKAIIALSLIKSPRWRERGRERERVSRASCKYGCLPPKLGKTMLLTAQTSEDPVTL